MIMKLAVMGAGSLGTIIGALISKNGYDIDLIDVNKEHVYALNTKGATLVGHLNETIPVKAILPSEMKEKYDIVFLLTKQLHNQSVLEGLLPYLKEDGTVVSLQNGIPEEQVASIVGKSRVVAGTVNFGATWKSPGVSELTTEYEAFKSNAFDIGELDGQITERIHTIQKILESVGHTEIKENLVGAKWFKLLVNVTMSGLSTALGCTFGGVLDNKVALTSAVHIMDEVIRTAKAQGITFIEMLGIDFNQLQVTDESQIPHRMQLLTYAFTPQRSLKASMLQDLEKGRKTEIDYINGVIKAKGLQLGVDTPFNNLVVDLVKKAEETQQLPVFEENIKYFEELLNSKGK